MRGIFYMVAGMLIVRLVKAGMSIDEAFKYITASDLLVLSVGVVVVSLALGFLLAAPFKLASIELTGEAILGRNYFGRKTTIPLVAIKGILPSKKFGTDGLVVDGGGHGEIYVWSVIYEFDELVEILESSVERSSA